MKKKEELKQRINEYGQALVKMNEKPAGNMDALLIHCDVDSEIDSLYAEIDRLGLQLAHEQERTKSLTNQLFMSPSEHCQVHHVQCCHVCEVMGCHDNVSPAKREIARLTKENEELRQNPLISVHPTAWEGTARPTPRTYYGDVCGTFAEGAFRSLVEREVRKAISSIPCRKTPCGDCTDAADDMIVLAAVDAICKGGRE
jgi:hypothetical protein